MLSYNYFLAQGFDALHSCSPEESYEIFDAIIQVQKKKLLNQFYHKILALLLLIKLFFYHDLLQHFPESIFSYIGRAISLGRLANKVYLFACFFCRLKIRFILTKIIFFCI